MCGYVMARVVPHAVGESKRTCIDTWSLIISMCVPSCTDEA